MVSEKTRVSRRPERLVYNARLILMSHLAMEHECDLWSASVRVCEREYAGQESIATWYFNVPFSGQSRRRCHGYNGAQAALESQRYR